MKSQESSDKYIGFWENEEKTIQIEIFTTGSSYSGKIIKVTNTNCVQKLNSIIINSMINKRENVLYGGTYADFERKKEYEIKIKLVTENHFFIKRPHRFFNKKEHWHKISN
jgi:uncharacterized protein (DUF2147 family)